MISPGFEISSLTNWSSRGILQTKFPHLYALSHTPHSTFRTAGMAYGTQLSWGTYQHKEPQSSYPCNRSCCICVRQQTDGSGWVHHFRSRPPTKSYLGPIQRKRLRLQRQSTHIEGQGPSKSEDIQLIMATGATGIPPKLKEVVARCSNRIYHVQWDYCGCAPSLL